MTDVVATARAKLAFHQKQVAELEAFLRVYDELSQEGSAIDQDNYPHPGENIVGNATTQKAVDKSPVSRRRKRSKMRPDTVSDLMARVIREVGRPMTRGEIVAAFDRRDVEIPYDDKPRYIGTIAWRNKGRFINIEGKGYWLRDEPLKEKLSATEEQTLSS